MFLKTDGAGNLSFSSSLPTTSFTGATAETSIADADLVLIYDDSATAVRKMTKANFTSGIGGTNTPSWSAKLSSSQTGIGAGSVVKITFNSEIFDTDNAYDPSTNYRFTVPSGKAGKYFVTAFLDWRSSTNARSTYTFIYKNGGTVIQSGYFLTSQYFQNDQVCSSMASAVLDLAVGDYIEVYGTRYDGTSQTVTTDSYFSGFKLI